ncbi:Nucleotide-binding universal stress protein, UspA family [Halogeometricum rufum]|uniref:Nucleotide-binding universal stress protein, UspA family n=1 Tax=Halogeometricum rufum TaxID=553469 RepID=A0A1I6IMH5_9EURY|nr:universal stress protein [Halogeometricum rufum]SFR67480.1 Nucleotide-binding universal stress protein, UspA family [Halogeometricum rufum]
MYAALVPVDRDRDRAFHQAKYVERLASSGGDVAATVLYVVPPKEFERADDVAFESVESAVEAADYLEDAGIPVTRAVGDGSPADEIVRTADELDADEIVAGGRKRSGVTPLLLGSTVHDVMLSADRPVTITGERSVFGEGTQTLLVAVDRDVERATRQADYVAARPNAEDVEAVVYYVFPHQDYKGAPPHEFEEVEAAVEAADRLEAAGVSVERLSEGGEVERKILRTADERDADGIVMGGRKRSGVQKVLLGSVALDVMLSADRPVTLTG